MVITTRTINGRSSPLRRYLPPAAVVSCATKMLFNSSTLILRRISSRMMSLRLICPRTRSSRLGQRMTTPDTTILFSSSHSLMVGKANPGRQSLGTSDLSTFLRESLCGPIRNLFQSGDISNRRSTEIRTHRTVLRLGLSINLFLEMVCPKI